MMHSKEVPFLSLISLEVDCLPIVRVIQKLFPSSSVILKILPQLLLPLLLIASQNQMVRPYC